MKVFRSCVFRSLSGRASSDLLNALPKMTPQKRPERYAVGVSDACSDLFYAFIRRFQQMYRALHTQLLEIRERRLPQDRLHAARQRSLTRSGGCSGILKRKPMRKPSSRPALEALHEFVRVRKMIDKDIGGLRRP